MYTPETLVPWEAAEGIEAKAGLQFGFQLRIESVGECSGYQQRTWWREERGDAGEPTWGQRVYRSRSLNAKTGVKYRGERDEQWHKYIHLLGLFLLGEERGQLRHAVGVRFFELLDAMGPLGRGLALLARWLHLLDLGLGLVLSVVVFVIPQCKHFRFEEGVD